MRFYRKFAGMHGLFVPTFLLISTFAQTAAALALINPGFSVILIIIHIQWAQASIDGYVQGFPETTFLKPTPLPSGTLHNYPRALLPKNAHCPVKAERLHNGVHPSKEGYFQIGDSIYCWIKACLTQNKIAG